MVNVRAIVMMKRDDDDTNRQITNGGTEDLGETTLSSNIEEDDLEIRQEVLHLEQAGRDKTIRTICVPLVKKWSHADTLMACAPLPNLRHPARPIEPPFVKGHKSVINISRKSDVVQALQLPKGGGDQNVPQPKAGGNHNIPQHQTATVEVANRFMEAVVFTRTPWPFICHENYSMVDEASQLAIEAQDHQLASAGAPVGTPSMSPLPGGPSLESDPQTRKDVHVYSIFCSSIGLMMILNLKTDIVKTKN
jgi:hypothetical protein